MLLASRNRKQGFFVLRRWAGNKTHKGLRRSSLSSLLRPPRICGSFNPSPAIWRRPGANPTTQVVRRRSTWPDRPRAEFERDRVTEASAAGVVVPDPGPDGAAPRGESARPSKLPGIQLAATRLQHSRFYSILLKWMRADARTPNRFNMNQDRLYFTTVDLPTKVSNGL